MSDLKPLDCNGVLIKNDSIVEIIEEKDGFPHRWLKVGMKKTVAYSEDRTLNKNYPYVVVFFKTKSGAIIQQGIDSKKLKVINPH